MAKSTEFLKRLDGLLEDQTRALRDIVGYKTKGRRTIFNPKRREKEIEKFQKIATDIYAKEYQEMEFERHAFRKRTWHAKGRGDKEKKNRFNDWYDKEINFVNCIYIFRNKQKRCIYVGKTENSGGRPSSHFEKKWASSGFRVDIYPVKAKSQLSKLECLAIHRFKPLVNTNKAAKRKHYKYCPICKMNETIESELREIIRINKK